MAEVLVRAGSLRLGWGGTGVGPVVSMCITPAPAEGPGWLMCPTVLRLQGLGWVPALAAPAVQPGLGGVKVCAALLSLPPSALHLWAWGKQSQGFQTVSSTPAPACCWAPASVPAPRLPPPSRAGQRDTRPPLSLEGGDRCSPS